MSKRSRAQKKRSREGMTTECEAPSVESTLSKTQKRKLQKKRSKEAAAKERAAQAAAAAPSAAKRSSAPTPAVARSQTALCVVYEDEHMVAISKPAGLLAHGSRSATEQGTVVHALSGRQHVAGYSPMPAYMLEARESYTGEADSFIPRAIVHRLDRGTTGLMVVAKSAAAERQLAAHFKQRTAHKRYVALLCGWPDASAPGTSVELDDSGAGVERLHISVPIDRDPARPGKMRAVVPDAASSGGGASDAGASWSSVGKAAHTLVHIHAYSAQHGGVCLCSMDLLTGRQHQIRVHCSHMGAPLLNDDAYGGKRCVRGAQDDDESALGPFPKGRPMLHAWAMEVPKPTSEHEQREGDRATEETLTLRAPLPDDMRSAIDLLWPNLGGPDSWPCLSPQIPPGRD